MASVLALSLSGSISQFSVIVAAAALLGVAVLTLLFFAQAREVKRLREWGEQAADRIAELTREQTAAAMRAAQLARGQAQRAAQPAGARTRQGSTRDAPPIARGAAASAAGMSLAQRVASGASALVQASTAPGTAVAGLRVAGDPQPASAPLQALASAGATLAAPAAQTLASPAPLPAAAGMSAEQTRSPRLAPAAAAPAATVAGEAAPAVGDAISANGPSPVAATGSPALGGDVEAPPAIAPTDRPVGAGNGVVSVSHRSSAPPALARSARPPAPAASGSSEGGAGETRVAGATGASGGARASLPPRPLAARRPASGESGAPTIYRRERSVGRILVIAIAAVLAVVLAVVLLLGSSGKSSPGPGSPAGGSTSQGGPSRAGGHRGAGVSNGSLRVAVLNATQTNGLAAKVASSLQSHGYAQATALFGTPAGSYPTTSVQYASGHSREATGVAQALNVPSADVKPLQSSTAPLSGGAPVVVIVGEATANEGAGGAPRNSESTTPAEGEAGGETAGGGEAGAGSQTAEPGA